jgi:hypothetical protein
MSITLTIDGKNESFTEQQLSDIVSWYYRVHNPEPQVGVPLLVCPLGINRELFNVEKNDGWQEETRKAIRWAFGYLDREPKYKKNFYATVSENAINSANSHEWKERGWVKDGFLDYPQDPVYHIADAVEFFLLIAQRIQNGETWEKICNEPDRFPYRQVVFEKGGRWESDLRVVGGSVIDKLRLPPSYSKDLAEYFAAGCSKVAPLIVQYVQE